MTAKAMPTLITLILFIFMNYRGRSYRQFVVPKGILPEKITINKYSATLALVHHL